MRQVIRELCSLLTEQKTILTQLLDLSKQEREVIIAGDTEKLEGIVRLELKGLSKLGRIEKSRAALHNAIAADFGISEKDITVTAIADRAQPDERGAIASLQEELTALINEHTKINSENRELIKAHLEYSEAMLDLMVESDDPLNNFYGGDGRTADDRKKSTGFFSGQA